MGCAQSRDEARKAAFSGDYNTVPYAYKACDNKSLDAFHPFDKFVSAYLGGSDKGLADASFKSFDPKEKTWGDKDVFKAPATTLFESLKGLHAWAKTGVDADKPTGWGKYNSKQVVDALDATLTNIASTFEELKWPEEAAPALDGGLPMRRILDVSRHTCPTCTGPEQPEAAYYKTTVRVRVHGSDQSCYL